MELDEILPGCKIDVVELADSNGEMKIEHAYVSSLYSVIETDIIEITTPQKKNTLVPMHQGVKYKLIFTTEKGLVRADCVVLDRYQSSNFFLTKVQIIGKLSKYQRREFYRIDCLVPCRFTELEDDDLLVPSIQMLRQNILTKKEKNEKISEEYGTIIDISGGGIRLTAPYSMKENDYFLFDFDLALDNGVRHVELVGRCVGSDHIPDTDLYSHRVKFDFMFEKVSQEIIVRYIFEIERKRRRKEQEI